MLHRVVTALVRYDPGAGRHEEALKWLTLACEERNVYALLIASDPTYDPLRANQRFAKLLRRMKLGS